MTGVTAAAKFSEAMDLGLAPASIYSALQRAHRAVDERLPERSQQATLRSLGDERMRIEAMTVFLTPEVFSIFGLPAELPG